MLLDKDTRLILRSITLPVEQLGEILYILMALFILLLKATALKVKGLCRSSKRNTKDSRLRAKLSLRRKALKKEVHFNKN